MKVGDDFASSKAKEITKNMERLLMAVFLGETTFILLV